MRKQRQRNWPIRTSTDRKKLPPRTEPYWYPMNRPGLYLGYCRTLSGGEWWKVRHRDAETGQRFQETLMPLDPTDPTYNGHDEAWDKALEWWEKLDAHGRTRAITVKDACEKYLRNLEREGRDGTEADARKRFNAKVFYDPIAKLKLDKLNPEDLRKWRDRVAGIVEADHLLEELQRPPSHKDQVAFEVSEIIALGLGTRWTVYQAIRTATCKPSG